MKPGWGIRPHTLGQWLDHLGISDREFDRLTAVACAKCGKPATSFPKAGPRCATCAGIKDEPKKKGWKK